MLWLTEGPMSKGLSSKKYQVLASDEADSVLNRDAGEIQNLTEPESDRKFLARVPMPRKSESSLSVKTYHCEDGNTSEWKTVERQAHRQRSTVQSVREDTTKHTGGGNSHQDTTADLDEDLYQILRRSAVGMEVKATQMLEAAKKVENLKRSFDLTNSGYRYRDCAKKLHEDAAEHIFAAENPTPLNGRADLHGLHVEEAISRLPGIILNTTARKLRIITGAGNHSVISGRPKLRRAVEEWLRKKGFQYGNIKDKRGHVGGFIVNLE